MRETVFVYLPFSDPGKAERAPFRYTAKMRRTIDQAIDLFLTEVAGPDRSREGFVNGGMASDTPDGIIQEKNFVTQLIGVERAGQMVGVGSTLAYNRQSPAVMKMLDNAFDRLSENGAMRLEGVRDEIHSVLVSATDAGLGPSETARQLARQFDQIEVKGYDFERLARTEAAFAAEAGSREQYREFGVTHVKWLISAGACPICVAYEGQIIPIEEVDDQPPAHPNCLCSIVPADADEVAAAESQAPPTGEQVADQILQQAQDIDRQIVTLQSQEQQAGEEFLNLNRARRDARAAGDDALGDRINAQVEQAQARVQSLYRERNALIREKSDRLQQLVAVDDPISLKPHWFPIRPAAPYDRSTAEEGIRSFERLVSQKSTADRSVAVGGTSGRSYHSAGTVNLDASANPKTVVHELGHWLEESNPRVHEAALDFLDRRTQGESLARLDDLLPGHGYDPSEVARPDQFQHPYIGKEYLDEKTGVRRASEVVSMGLEMMHEDAAEFARRDKDHFAFIYDLVRGRFRS
jgi:SPP1 gp7 family putative phage head morphogenesis protein